MAAGGRVLANGPLGARECPPDLPGILRFGGEAHPVIPANRRPVFRFVDAKPAGSLRTSSWSEPGASAPLVELTGVSVTYPAPRQQATVEALRTVDLVVEKGSFYLAHRPIRMRQEYTASGGRRSDHGPLAGRQPSRGNRPPQRAARARSVLYFQEPALLEWRSTLENVALPLELQGIGRARREAEARRLLDLVGPERFRDGLAFPALGRHEAARVDSPRTVHFAACPADGRTVRRTRPDHPGPHESGTGGDSSRKPASRFFSLRTPSGRAVFLSDNVVVMSPRPGPDCARDRGRFAASAQPLGAQLPDLR